MRAVEAAIARSPDAHLDYVLDEAEAIYTWVVKPAPVVRLVGLVGAPFPTPEGSIPMANPQIPAGFSFTITIEPEDTLGVAVADTLTWTSSDVVAAPVAVDTTTLVGTVKVVSPATAVVVTATDGTNTFTYTFDAVVDAPVTLAATVSVPFKTPAA